MIERCFCRRFAAQCFDCSQYRGLTPTAIRGRRFATMNTHERRYPIASEDFLVWRKWIGVMDTVCCGPAGGATGLQ